ncbi:PREDICTED: oxysterol-binding protein-related protein 6-like [Priapulus caudatus]|uniref:Oxysterol-binding protein-related protein 6-like n=1 Tax=Priapulus caudatus TaxID=37621 RepID=A0ABM1EH02_PRICU|nr:PREDICTED: oxysterol-binding protein-related protein 6-like [Priapulus caudatus]
MSVSPENVMKGGGNDDTDDMENKSDDSTESKTENVKPASRRRHRHQRKPPAKVEWEVIEGLKQGQRCETKPEKHEGYMMKRRKWPLKGWHKRYFALEKGFLAYGKTAELMHKGKLHGSVDVGLSVVSVKQQEMHIDIDAEDFLYHLKVKEHDAFEGWVKQLRHHRLYRQHELSYGVHDLPRLIDIQSPTKDLASPVFPLEERVFLPSSRSSSLRVGESHGRLGTWIRESAGLERYDKELTSARLKSSSAAEHYRQPTCRVWAVHNEARLQETAEAQKAETRKKEKRQKESDTNSNSSSKTSLSAATLMATTPEGLRTSSSNPNLPSLRPTSLTDVNSPLLSVLSGSTDSFDSHGLHDDFVKVAEEVHDQLRGLLRSIQTERDRLKNVLEHECNPAASASASPAVVVGPNATVIQSLRIALNQAVQQNAELRARLSRIHVEAMVPEMDAVLSPTIDATVMNESCKLATSKSIR